MGDPPSRSACRRASRMSHGLRWMPAAHRAALRLCMPTVPVRLELNSSKISWNAAGGERGGQQGESRTPTNPEICPPSSERTEDLGHSNPLGIITSAVKNYRGCCVDGSVPIQFSCPKLMFGHVCMKIIQNSCPRSHQQQGPGRALGSGSMSLVAEQKYFEAAGALACGGHRQ